MNHPKGVPSNASWNKNSQLWEAGEIKKNKRNGAWKSWLRSGRLHIQAFYNENGKLEGEYRVYHVDGGAREVAQYKNGVLDGEKRIYRSRTRTHVGLPQDIHWQIWSISYDYKNGFLIDARMLMRNGREYMKRPDKLPVGSLLTSSGYWEHGNFNEGKREGEWKSWRSDGTLRSNVFFKKGKQEGHQKQFHANGELGWEAIYKNGKIQDKETFYRGSARWSDVSFPNEANRKVVKVIKFYRNGQYDRQEYYNENGQQCNRHGRIISAKTINKSYQVDIADFIEKGLPSYIQSSQSANLTIDINLLKSQFKTLWGKEIPKDLEGAMYLFYQSDFPKILDFQTHPLRLSSLNDEDINIVEEAILNFQTIFPADNIVDWFTGTVCLDDMIRIRYHKNYSLQYGLYDTELTPFKYNQIYDYQYYNPDYDATMNRTKARDLGALLMLYTGADAFEYRDLINEKTLMTVYQKTKSKVEGNYYTFQDITVGGNRYGRRSSFNYYDIKYQGSRKPAVDYFYKNKNILDVLRFNRGRKFSGTTNPEYQENRFERIVPEALFCLFESYFRKDDERNDKYLNWSKEHASRIVRDAGELITEFRNGRKRLGLIRDMEALRK